MSHPSTHGNGCSLEDCHTNLFALTDLDGIKWRRLTADANPDPDPLEDPVLSSYSRCLQADILCVWRRAHRSSEQRSIDHLTCQKELWIFWYGEEPPNLYTLLSRDLHDEEKGSWDNGGLSYECRTLLFKALHNLIERCLLSQNFVRLGMWFVQPHDYGSSTMLTDRSTHFSIKFSFFLHGESQVCASIDVRQHMPMRRLQPYHLALLSQGSMQGIHVILAPYGLQGTVTGHTFKETEHATQKLLEDWKQFYVIKDFEKVESEQSKMPPAVEVVVAGVRMRYPTQFVLVTAETEAMLIARNPGCLAMNAGGMTSVGAMPLTPPQSPGNSLGEGGVRIPPMPTPLTNLEPPISVPQGGAVSARVIEKVWQDCCLTTATQPQRPTLPAGGDAQQMPDDGSAVGVWDFAEPLQKTTCQCSKAKVKQRPPSGMKNPLAAASKHPKERTDKPDKPSARHSRTLSFHRRNTLTDDYLQQDIDLVAQRMPGGFAAFKTPGVVVPGGPITPLSHNRSFGDQSIDSPHSAAPSPLVATPSQPALNQNADPTMPTLSPHPPAKPLDKELNTSGSGPQLAPFMEQQQQTSGSAFVSTKDQPHGGVAPKQESGVDTLSSLLSDIKPEVTACADTQRQSSQEWRGLKRPMLPVKSYEDTKLDTSTMALYDFKPLQAWFDHPWKRHRREGRGDLRQGYSASPLSINGSSFAKSRDNSPPSSSPTMHDPYEFSDESSNAGNFGRAFRNREDSTRSSSLSKNEHATLPTNKEDEMRLSSDGFNFKDEQKSTMGEPDLSPHTPGGPVTITSFTSEKDLIPRANDLDNLFESDSESSDADAFQVSTPPGSNKPSEDIKLGSVKCEVNRTSGGGTDIIGDYRPTPKELSRMFPTPPSMDNQHNQLSPCMATDTAEAPAALMELAVPRTDLTALARSALESSIKDWSFVFKPPTMATFVHSPRYSPIELPSSKEPSLPVPLLYKPSWQYNSLSHSKEPRPPLSSHYTNVPSVEPRSVPDHRMTSIEASPAPTFPASNQQRTPLSYELPSPMSNASSYMNKSVDPHGTNSPLPEAHSLVTTIMLSDSSLNLFKDHNFDSCTLCVCNMNIKGADIGVYLPDKNAEPQYKCTCGFSAVTNRRLGKNAGLFYEDEVDITGIRDDRYDRRKPSLLEIEHQKDSVVKDGEARTEEISQDVLCLLQSQFSTFFPSEAVLNCYSRQKMPLHPEQAPNFLLEIQDGCEACYIALEAGRQAMDNCVSSKLEDAMLKSTCLHKWPYVQSSAKIPANSQDVVALLQSLQPLLQDTIQKKRATSFFVYTVSGPLTWKDFHLLAGRGQDEASEPQPIPPLLLGHEKDWLSLSPQALQFWDKLLLEPYSRTRDIAYIVVAPESDFMLNQVKFFFKELSTVYESCRLGRHVPIDRVLRDGIMRVGKSAASKISNEEVHEWFNLIGNSPLAAKLKLYSQVCKHRLAPYLMTFPLDKSLFEAAKNMANGHGNPGPQNRATPKPSPTPSPAPPGSSESTNSSSHSQNHTDEKGENCDSLSSTKDCEAQVECDHHVDDADLPGLVIYMVDPFSFAQDWEELNRLSTIGLLRCFQDMVKTLPEPLASSVQLQLVPLQSILNYSEQPNVQHLKALAMSTFTQCRRNLAHTILGRSLTGFGPAASAEIVLKLNEPARMLTARAFAPPFILAPQKDLQIQLAETWGERVEKSGTLFCSYCLSEDQHWLITVVTDKQGEILETCTINIDIPNRNRRKKASARKIGLSKLWDFLIGVISTTARPWRLVIGRFGRIGHGELQGWAGLLSRKNLTRASKQLKDMCSLCGIGAAEMPCILSACLVSMDVHPSVHVMTDSVHVEEKMSSNCQLSTPRDASATHILVFPTSATAQANSGPVPHDNQMDLADNFGAGLDGEGDLYNNLLQDGELGDLHDLFGGLTSPVGSPTGSPKNHSAPGSPIHGAVGRNSPTQNGLGKANGPMSMGTDAQEEQGNLLMQPLAMGFYISTAPTGPMPKWFWSSCPHREGLCPTCFKAALHIHCPNVQQNHDEFMPSNPNRHCHPLDSNFTCDVLRSVLETFNALSWLSIDPRTNDRRSCLPIHFVVLLQLYTALQAYV